MMDGSWPLAEMFPNSQNDLCVFVLDLDQAAKLRERRLTPDAMGNSILLIRSARFVAL
jgi:hypothetical protein